MVRQQIATCAADRLNVLRERPTVLAGLILLAAVVFAPRVDAAIFDSNGFEAPGYDINYLPSGGYLGQLEGQPGGPPPHWQVTTSPVSTATVQTAIVESGSQAVRLDRHIGDNARWGVPVTGYPLSPTDTISVTWDMLLPSPAAGTARQFGPFFGVQAYGDPSGAGSLLGSWGADATTREVLVQYPLGGGFPGGGGIQDIGGLTVNFNEWNTFQMLLDFSSKTYDVLLNGVLLPTGPIPFIHPAFTTFSDADITGLAIPDDIAGTAYFDNFSEQTVPEPSSLLVWGTVALLSLIGVRVRTAAKRSFPDLSRC